MRKQRRQAVISIIPKSFNLILILFITATFFSCASYKPAPLSNLQPEFAPYAETVEAVTLACKALSREDCKRYFDRDIIDKGFQPVQMTIINNSDKYLLFSTQGVSLPVCSPQEVADKCHTSTVGRATGYGVAGLIVWPLLIPAVVDGVSSSQANTKLDSDFGQKGMEQTVINPYSTHNGIIFFTKDDYQDSFNVRLVDRETKRKLEYSIRGLEAAK